MRMISLGMAAALMLGTTTSATASVLLDDIYHASTLGGVWNDDDVRNWGIWVAPGTNPNAVTSGDFLNPGNPIGQSISIPYGTSSYVLFKNECCAGSSSDDKFTFDLGTLDLGNTLGAYHAVNDAPQAIGQSISAGGKTVTVVSFSWYNSDVFGVDQVGQGQNFGPNGQLDHIGLLTLNVVPEPASLALLGIGAVGLFAAARRRKAV